MEKSNVVMFEMLHNNADWDCFKTLTLSGIVKTQNQHQVHFCACSEVTRSCNKLDVQETDFSFTQFDIISLPAGLRMDGVPALDLWDLVIEVFHCSPNQLNNTKGQVQGNLSRDTTSNKHNQNKTKVPTEQDNFDLDTGDRVPSNAKFSRFGAMPYIFEDNDAVIKMIIKGRSPTMRHVSRTHRVALGWLTEKNLDHQNQIKYVDTEHQLAEILTNRNFTRDEWNNLLHLFNISHFSSLCCAQNFSLTSCTKTMARRMAFSVSTSSSGDTQSTLSNILVTYRET